MTADAIEVREILAHCLLMGRGAYPSPEAWAGGILARLAHEGLRIVRPVQLEPWQVQADDDCPGLYLQCASAEQRQAIMQLVQAARGT